MVGVGAMVGAGIFALTGIASGAAGPGLILAFALNGILTMCTAMVYAEIGSAIPAAGGGYLWTKFGLPGPSAFLAGWMDWLAHAVAGSLYAVIFGSYTVWGLQTILGWGEPPTGAIGRAVEYKGVHNGEGGKRHGNRVAAGVQSPPVAWSARDR